MPITTENLIELIVKKSSHIKGKAVILCEGNIQGLQRRRNPQAYRQLDQLPDANFYTRCLPKRMRKSKKPVFIPCGSRNEVIKTFHGLHDHLSKEEHKQNSYLDIDKLFALIDLDIQNVFLSDSQGFKFHDGVSCSESLHEKTFDLPSFKLNPSQKQNVFATGFIHKEAYFMSQLLHEFYSNYHMDLVINEQDFSLFDTLVKIVEVSKEDNDLIANFELVKRRLNHMQFSGESVGELVQYLKLNYLKSIPSLNAESDLILLVCKAKTVWEGIRQKDDGLPHIRFKEQLVLQIGDFYSQLESNKCHLVEIFEYIYESAYKS